MSRFIESIQNEIYNNDDKRPLEDDLSDTFIDDIKAYVDFLEDVPDDSMRWVGKYFVLLVADYNFKTTVYYKDNKEYNQNTMGKRQRDKDLELMVKYREMLNRLGDISDRGYLAIYPHKAHNTLIEAHRTLVDLMDDLGNEKYRKIPRDKYYKNYAPNKTAIRDFLVDTKNKYNLRCTDLQITELLEQL